MSKGSEIPYRRDKHAHDTGSLVLDQHRKAVVAEAGADGKPASAPARKPDAG
jgi:hypothetical protein